MAKKLQSASWLAFGIGLTFAVGGAMAQEHPAPPPGPWMVFFDWGKTEIRGDDQAVLDQAATAFRSRPSPHLLIRGHTDRSGSAASNYRAGLRRAELVRSELAKRGVPWNRMSVASSGEDQLLVPTEDGVREVQNRRVVIGVEE